MKVAFHPEFPRDQRKFEADYREISPALAGRFSRRDRRGSRRDQGRASGAGHFLHTGSAVVPEFRRRNLHAFPFFVLYGWTGDTLIFGAIIPTRSDPLTWLTRFPAP